MVEERWDTRGGWARGIQARSRGLAKDASDAPGWQGCSQWSWSVVCGFKVGAVPGHVLTRTMAKGSGDIPAMAYERPAQSRCYLLLVKIIEGSLEA